MADVVITRAPGQVERYPLPEEFTYGEASIVKGLTGLMPGQFMEALDGGDAGLIVAFAVISAARAGTDLDPETLYGLPFGAITVEDDEDRPTEPAAADGEPLPATTPEPGGNPS